MATQKAIESISAEMQAAIDGMVKASGIQHGRIKLELKVVSGHWEIADIDCPRRVVRRCVEGR